MATTSACAKIFNDFDLSCECPVRRFHQQLVLINKDDIDVSSIVKTMPDALTSSCAYNVAFNLNTATTGFAVNAPVSGNNIFGSYDKSKSDLGYAQYIHNVQMLVAGVGSAAKCILDALDKGNYVAALQLQDGTVLIYGMDNGLTTGDYSYNIQEGAGGTPIMLSSMENAPECSQPLIYVSAIPGSETADFDSKFAA